MKPTKRNTNPIEFKIYTEILHRQNIMKTLKRKPIFTPLPIKVKQNSVIVYIMSEFAKKMSITLAILIVGISIRTSSLVEILTYHKKEHIKRVYSISQMFFVWLRCRHIMFFFLLHKQMIVLSHHISAKD